jgi:pyridoxamine 5'-phosphate oxidase
MHLFFYYQKKFETVAHIPMPDHWGGYILEPTSIEFWQGRENRLNDRLLFTLEDGRWKLNRLSP